MSKLEQFLGKSHRGCRILLSEQLFPFPTKLSSSSSLSSQTKGPQSNQVSDKPLSANEAVPGRWVCWMEGSLSFLLYILCLCGGLTPSL